MESGLVLNQKRKEMKKQDSGSKSILEMLFENKNRVYGAYAIRMAYNATLIKSLCTTIGFFMMTSISIYLYIKKDSLTLNGKDDQNISTKYPIYSVKTMDLRPAIEERKQIEKQRTAKKDAIATVIKEQSQVKESNITNSESTDIKIEGEKSTENTFKNEVLCIDCDNAKDGKQEEKIEFVADVMPEFPGGVNALMKFISGNLIYPEKARILALEGIVVVNFVVDEGGKITNLKFLKTLGGGCEEEVERVLKLMPLWKPGSSNGRNVKVYYNLPVRFRFQ
jgi:protein TonB